ncbi:DinB family protein [Flavobacterium sp. 3HN19-14]|uniref:DinB family protein n=1 Tax=Flavobacterium sp. 3HN19-14 TaxID=3448133 RepID=UPI003EE2A4A6
MNLIPMFLKEMEKEALITRKFLTIVPEGKFDFKPHEKSMTLKSLATHLAELPAWVEVALTTEGLDFAKMDYKPTEINSAEELVKLFDESLVKARKQLIPENEGKLEEKWTLRSGDQIFSEDTKAETIRHAFNQMTHHRAQLGVYFRLLDINVPASYGPSADDMGF